MKYIALLLAVCLCVVGAAFGQDASQAKKKQAFVILRFLIDGANRLLLARLTWQAALAVLLLIYFYAHYAFASITAHATAMYIPFLTVILVAGAPPYLAILSLAYFSNLDASLTHYGTTPAPIWFGAGYVKQRTWWWLGLIISVSHIVVWTVIGFLWWKLLGWW